MKRRVLLFTVLLAITSFGAVLAGAENSAQESKNNTENSTEALGADSAPELSPLETVESTVAELVAVVQEYADEDQVAVRRQRLREVIEPRFDFEEMARRSLGAHWSGATSEQQHEFVELFSDMLAETYLNRIENIEKDTVSVEGERVAQQVSLVRTIVTHRGDRFPIDYRLIMRDGQWLVYDVIIENIALVANYRNEFAGIIRREQMSGLLERLRDKR